jgi:hypothetical protein
MRTLTLIFKHIRHSSKKQYVNKKKISVFLAEVSNAAKSPNFHLSAAQNIRLKPEERERQNREKRKWWEE